MIYKNGKKNSLLQNYKYIECMSITNLETTNNNISPATFWREALASGGGLLCCFSPAWVFTPGLYDTHEEVYEGNPDRSLEENVPLQNVYTAFPWYNWYAVEFQIFPKLTQESITKFF